jgi:xylulokinase
MSEPVFIGVDLGTTSCKADAFTLSGEMLGHGASACSVDRPKPDWAEQNPEEIWESAVRAIRGCVVGIDPSRVRGIGCCGHTPSLVLLDSAGKPVRPVIIWQDDRAKLEARELDEVLNSRQWEDLLGLDLPRSASYPPARLRWLARHESEALARTKHLLQPKDYLNYRLTGVVASDYWGSKGLAHLQTGQPIAAYREILAIDPGLAPPCDHPHHIAGKLSSKPANELGLPVGTPVAIGWTDALCGMLGTGALAQSGLAFDIAGTSEIVGVTATKQPSSHEGVLVAPILDTDLSIVYGPTQMSGGSVDWYLAGFHPSSPERELRTIDELISPDVGEIIFLPYLKGERAPIWNPNARGVFFGISLEHTTAHFLRAILEGVAFSIRHVLERSELATGVKSAAVYLSGGGATSARWNQIKSDVLDRNVQCTKVRDAGTLGAAMLAALAVGELADIKSATLAMVQWQPLITPNPAYAGTYDRLYETYQALYTNLRDLFPVGSPRPATDPMPNPKLKT